MVYLLKMLEKTVKYRKQHQIFLRQTCQGQTSQFSQIKSFDRVLLRSASVGPLQFEEYEALRRILSRKLNRLLRFSLVAKPYVMVTAKPREMRMGKGKGAFSHYHLPMRAGAVFSRISWCHRHQLVLFLHQTRNSMKKSAQSFRL